MRHISYMLATRAAQIAKKAIEKKEDKKIFSYLKRMVTIKTVVLQRNAIDGLTRVEIPKGTKALKLTTHKGSSSMITFYSFESAVKLRAMFQESMADFTEST